MTATELLQCLQGVRRSGAGWTARCPAHDDRQASLSIGEGDDGRVLVKCFAGCEALAIVQALGIELRDLYADTATNGNGHRELVATYTYRDADGAAVCFRDRFEWFEHGKREKSIIPRQPDGTKRGSPPLPYRLPEMLRAIEARAPIILVEGEKAADVLAARGFIATTTGGATSWRSEFAEYFRGADVVLWPDADAPGEKYIAAVARDLRGIAASVRVLQWPGAPEHWDAADFFMEGGSVEQLDALLAEAPAYEAAEVPQECAGPDETWPLLRDLLDRPELLAPPASVLERLAWQGRATLLVGTDKSGKSTMAAHAATALTRGGWWLGARCGQGRVIVCAPDEAVGDSVRRLHELGADPDRVRVLLVRPPDMLASLRAVLAAWPAELVIVDSLAEWARLTRGTAPEDGDAAGWGAVVRPLVEIAHTVGCALLLLHHARRSDGQYRGSLEIAAAADILLELLPPRDGEDAAVRRIRGRGRWPVEPYAVALRDGRYELVGGPELSVDVRVLIDIETHPGTSASAVRERVQGRDSTITAAIHALIQRGAIDRGSDGRLYAARAEQGVLVEDSE